MLFVLITFPRWDVYLLTPDGKDIDMIDYRLPDEVENPVVAVTLEKDKEGDIRLRVGGIHIMFLSSNNGTANFFTKSDDDIARLKSFGFSIDDGRVEVAN